jgi:hypothetical protein
MRRWQALDHDDPTGRRLERWTNHAGRRGQVMRRGVTNARGYEHVAFIGTSNSELRAQARWSTQTTETRSLGRFLG